MRGVVAITGANGFIGRALAGFLAASGFEVRPIVRTADSAYGLAVGNIDSRTNWSEALRGVDAVVHCAARVHVMRERAEDPLLEFRRTNVEGTQNLAEQAVQAGVRRLVFLSSVKVNGDSTTQGNQFRTSDLPMPMDAYGQSKWEAEQVLLRTMGSKGLEVVIVRPPLVYGPGVGANFLRLTRLVESGLPLPLGAVTNKRSMVGIDNLTDLLRHCLVCPAAPGETFFVSDGRDLSTAELVGLIADALGQPARLFPVPLNWLRAVARLAGQADIMNRLVESLQVDMTTTFHTLGWHPPYTVEQQIGKAVAALRGQK